MYAAYRADREQGGGDHAHGAAALAEDEDALFVASSGSESSSEGAGVKRAASRKRLRQKKPASRPKAERKECKADGPVKTKAAEAIIVLDSDSDDADTVSTAPAPPVAAVQTSSASQEKLEWECPKCTYLNETSSNVCEICTSPCPTRKLRNLSQWLAPTDAKQTRKPKSQAGVKEEMKNKKKRSEPSLEVIDSSGGSDLDSDSGRSSQARLGAASRLKTPTTAPSAQSNALWADTHTPSTVEELCVNMKKIQELSEWLNSSAWPISAAAASHSFHPRKRLLFLCGPPGSGKSAAVRCIAKQMGLGVKEWNDNTSAGKLSYERMLQEQFWTHQTSGADDFMDFITRSVSYAALPMAPATTGSERRVRKRKLLASSQGREESQSQPPSVQPQAPSSQVILIENWPQNWSKPGSAWEDKVQKVFRLVVDPAGKNQFPVICIFSDVRENKLDPKQLAKLFSSEVMNSPFTSVMNFNSVTAGTACILHIAVELHMLTVLSAPLIL